MKTFTDTEMLDWMIEGNKKVCKAFYGNGVYILKDSLHTSGIYTTPREAIAAERNKENA